MCASRDDKSPELWKSEEMCRMLTDTARVYIHHFSIDGTITYMNKYAEELSGYSQEEVIGKNLVDVFAPAGTRDQVLHDLKPVFSGEPTVNYEAPMLTKSGEERIMLWSGALTYDREGKPLGVVASGVDITDYRRTQEALRRSEEMYRTLVDHNVAGVFMVRGTKIVFANKRVEEIIGYTMEEARDMNFWDFVDPKDRELVKERAARRLRGEVIPEHYEYTMLRKGGEAREAEIWATVVLYEGEKTILATVVDVTERRRMEEAIRESERILERQKQLILRQTIMSVTQGKLEIMEREEIADAMEGAEFTLEVAKPEDTTKARHRVREFALRAGLVGERLEFFLLAVGEAVSNVLKHAGRGILMAGAREGDVWVGVVDRGLGMDTLLLTQALFRKGFSTKPSLGLGYTIMLDCADHILLSTSPTGTTVVVKKSIAQPPETIIDLARVPHAW